MVLNLSSITTLILFLPHVLPTPYIQYKALKNVVKEEGNETDVTVISTTIRPSPTVVSTTTSRPGPTRTRACSCSDGKCRCCSGAVMSALNFPINQKLCVDVLYTPEEFQFDFNVNFNDRVLYRNKISGKNPRPLCIPLSRFLPVNVCMKFSNIYMIGRNIHACLDVEGSFLDAEIFEVNFECFRLGTNGIALLRPEDGGGLAEGFLGGPSTKEPDDDSDYDDSA